MNDNNTKNILTIDPNWVNIAAKAEVVTPTTAAEWLSRNLNNRPLTKNQVKYYARQMREGKWKINGEAICLDKNGNLINGQHRLSAVVESAVPIAALIVRGVDTEAFATFDSGKNRTIADVFYLKSINNAHNVSAIVSNYLTLRDTGINIFANHRSASIADSNKRNRRATKQEILEEYFSDPEFYQEVYSFSNSCYKRLRILNTTKIGASVAFLVKEKRHEVGMVCEFFTQLTTESSFENSTIAILRSKLIKDQMSNPNMRMSGLYAQQLLVKTWNAFIDGRNLKSLSWDENKEGKLQFK